MCPRHTLLVLQSLPLHCTVVLLMLQKSVQAYEEQLGQARAIQAQLQLCEEELEARTQDLTRYAAENRNIEVCGWHTCISAQHLLFSSLHRHSISISNSATSLLALDGNHAVRSNPPTGVDCSAHLQHVACSASQTMQPCEVMLICLCLSLQVLHSHGKTIFATSVTTSKSCCPFTVAMSVSPRCTHFACTQVH